MRIKRMFDLSLDLWIDAISTKFGMAQLQLVFDICTELQLKSFKTVCYD